MNKLIFSIVDFVRPEGVQCFKIIAGIYAPSGELLESKEVATFETEEEAKAEANRLREEYGRN